MVIMQISRHWRLNAKRYRLEGVRYETGAVSLQERPLTDTEYANPHQTVETPAKRNTKAAAAA
jgi:hypothetical protein